jgi:GalNAc-alpha-(1->4)-GalNAc-alpha-(1->3)-diNAcBac-PP-undecaprenol alpha-1,4-N-acetyl-D-galactosaminyltransferase
MRIALCISTLGLGGAQKVLINIGRALAEEGHNVYILTLDPSIDDFYVVPSEFKRLKIFNSSSNASCRWFDLPCQVKKYGLIRRALLSTNPDLVLSFIDTTNVSVLIAMKGTGVPVIVSERIFPGLHKIGKKWSLLRRLYYPHASKLVAVTKEAADYFGYLPTEKKKIIPNGVPSYKFDASRPRQKKIIAAGRLNKQKGFDLLITAFSTISDAYPDWSLEIYGDGEERQFLEELIISNGLDSRISLMGSVNNIASLMLEASVFVLSSRYEGFPNALAEAMSLGMAVVSFDCLSGPSALIEHEVNGLLIPPESIPDLTIALKILMDDSRLLEKLANNAAKIVYKYSEEQVLKLWVDTIYEAAGCNEK